MLNAVKSASGGKKKVTKAIIPAAGLGTRFLPATKAQPKEMLPIIDKPVIQYVVEEVVASGIKDIIIVTNGEKRSIEDHFNYSPSLEKQLKKSGKNKELAQIRRLAEMATFVYTKQKGPYGQASAVRSCEHLVGNEPFAVIWGDEFIYSRPPRLKQLIAAYNKYQHPAISAVRIKDKKALSKYGLVEAEKKIAPGVFEIKELHEKPAPGQEPSNLAAHGAYIFPPEVFQVLKKQKVGRANELWLVDTINLLAEKISFYAVEIKNGRYYDTGNKLEYLKTNVEFGLEHSELKKEFKKYLKDLKI